MIRLSAATAALSSALLLLLCAVVAYAHPSFVLTELEAKSGDAVHFAISGTEGDASYVLQIGGEEVAEGDVAEGNRVSGALTMPNLGNTSRTVTVEAQISESDEPTILTRELRYLAPPQVVTGPAATQPATAVAPAPRAQPAPARGSRPRSRPRRRPASRRQAEAPRGRSPSREREHRVSERQRSGAASERARRRGARVSTRRTQPGAPAATPRSASAKSPFTTGSKQTTGSKDRLPSGPNGTLLGVFSETPTTAFAGGPATSSPISAVADGDGGGAEVAAAALLSLLGLAALVLASPRLTREWRPAAVEGRRVDDARLAALARMAQSGADLQRGIARRRGSRSGRDVD